MTVQAIHTEEVSGGEGPMDVRLNASLLSICQAMGSSLERNSIDFLAPDTPTDR